MIPIRKTQTFLLLVVMLALQACGTANPLARAETVEQKAYAAYGTFVIFEEQGAKLVASGEIPRSAVIRIGEADRRAKPVADNLLEATLEFEQVRDEYETCNSALPDDCDTKQEKFISGLNSLDGWVTRFGPLLNSLTAAIKGAQ